MAQKCWWSGQNQTTLASILPKYQGKLYFIFGLIQDFRLSFIFRLLLIVNPKYLLTYVAQTSAGRKAVQLNMPKLVT